MLLLTHLSIVLGFKLPQPLEQTSAANEKVRSTAQEDAEDAKKPLTTMQAQDMLMNDPANGKSKN